MAINLALYEMSIKQTSDLKSIGIREEWTYVLNSLSSTVYIILQQQVNWLISIATSSL